MGPRAPGYPRVQRGGGIYIVPLLVVAVATIATTIFQNDRTLRQRWVSRDWAPFRPRIGQARPLESSPWSNRVRTAAGARVFERRPGARGLGVAAGAFGP